MNKSIEKIIKVVIFILLIIAIIVFIVLKVNKSDEEPDDNINIIETEIVEEAEEHVKNVDVKKVEDVSQYYKVKNIIDNYFEELNRVKSNPQDELEKEDSKLSITTIMKMLSSEYVDEFKITEETIIKEAEKYKDCEYMINDMYVLEISNKKRVFLTKVGISDKKDDINFLILLDYENNAFEMYGNDYVEKYGYDENEDKLTSFEVNEIAQNSFNKIKSVLITDEDMAINYFNNYKYNILNNIEKAFNSLDEEYRNKRFGSFDEFENYIEENRDIFKDVKIEQYLCNKYDDYKEYVCKDQHENLYIFKEIAVMEYTVKLDTYTITTQKFKEEYEKADVKKKVTMNIGKFIDMINNYDYKSAYAVLNGSFKEKYFKTEDDFKVYMQNKYYKYNEILLDSFSNESGTYVYKGSIKNKLNKDDDTKILNIVMKLKNGIDFEMSFEVY